MPRELPSSLSSKQDSSFLDGAEVVLLLPNSLMDWQTSHILVCLYCFYSSICCLICFTAWSAPSAIGTAGMGVGGQIGAEITDFVIILNTDDAVRAFSMGGNVTIGGNLSVAAGPFGRNAEASGAIGCLAAIYSYSKTKGLFAGVSIEGSVIVERKETNASFYNARHTPREILSGSVMKPNAAQVLYRALDRRVAASNPQMPQGSELNTANPMSAPIHNSSNLPAYTYGGPVGSSKVSPPTPGYIATPTTSTGLRKPPPIPPVLPPRVLAARALYDFNGEQPTDLSFKKDDIVIVTKRTDSTESWWEGECDGRKGEFPGNYVQL
ncbi:hypothetical protein RTP6_003261 [Batrachochytrium dendrobatidis]